MTGILGTLSPSERKFILFVLSRDKNGSMPNTRIFHVIAVFTNSSLVQIIVKIFTLF